MADPLGRIRKFVDVQRQKACFEEAKVDWARKLTELTPEIEAVVAALCSELVPGQFAGVPGAVLMDTSRDQFPLVIAFSPRVYPDGGLRLRSEPTSTEVGASTVFRCEPDGHVYGFRYPFHPAWQALGPEPYVDLGFPTHIAAGDIGDAIADFLEWMSTGAGCAGRPLQFWSPATLPFPKAQIRWDGRAA